MTGIALVAKTLELLAPAGDMASFAAALSAGADAIYLGLGDFNARRNAENLTLGDLESACRMAHLADRRIYLTLNILIGDGEMDRAIALAADAWDAGVDAAIVQDIGLATRLRDELPGLELHTSTQMNLMNRAGIDFARSLGVQRVTLARELSLDELDVLSKEGVELEVFAHGALCICYSGQCLMSSLIGRRSANRGLCAQPCRLPWELVDASGEAASTPGPHLLSPKDLCTVDILPRLASTGVRSLKIEGRMKSPAYVSTVVGVYRRCIDRALADPDGYRATDDERNRLAEAFSRGFSTAYLEGIRDNSMMSYQRPNNRGVPIGRVGSVGGGMVEIVLSKPVIEGDVLEFWTTRGRHAQEISGMLVDGAPSKHADAGSRLQMAVSQAVAPGDRVFRVRSAEIEGESIEMGAFCGIEKTLSVKVEARLSKPLHITVSDEQRRSGSAEGAACEPARSKAITEDDLREQIGRLGGTPYRIGKFEAILDDGVGMGFSQIHRVRRAAIEAYEASVLAAWSGRDARSKAHGDGHPAHDAAAGERLRRQRRSDVRALQEPEVAAFAATPEAAASCSDAGASLVYAPAEELAASMRAGNLDEWGTRDSLVCVLPTIIHNAERDAWTQLLEDGSFASVVCDDVASAALYAGRFEVEAGPRTNVLNQESASALVARGISRLWLSPELSLGQVSALLADGVLPATIATTGRQELMVTQHCELMSLGPCAQNCGSCPRRAQRHFLRDAKGYSFPVATDASGRGHVFNSVELDIVPQARELVQAGASRFLVDVRLADASRAAFLVRRACEAASGCVDAEAVPLVKLPDTTTGHLFRGVL